MAKNKRKNDKDETGQTSSGGKAKATGADPAVIATQAPSTSLPMGFSLDDPKLPASIADAAMTSGGYPYDKKLKREKFEDELHALQIELCKLQAYNIKSKSRILVIFEGRDGAGKGSCIKAFSAYLNPRNTRDVALTKPTETERGQLYFQRYAAQLPTAGEIVLFDRSWYNRAGVERVMGFCTAEQLAVFLREAPEFEGLLVRDGMKLFKFYLSLGREMQIARFHERKHNPLKQWKLSDVDVAALQKWDAYSEAAAEMFRFTHTTISPWIVIRANDQRRARLECIRAVLGAIDYEGRDLKAIGKLDPLISGSGPAFFNPR